MSKYLFIKPLTEDDNLSVIGNNEINAAIPVGTVINLQEERGRNFFVTTGLDKEYVFYNKEVRDNCKELK